MTRLAAACAALLLGSSLAPAGEARLADAAEARNAKLLLALLEQEAPVNAAQADGMTALHWAVWHDDLDLAGPLVEAGADVNLANRYEVRPLSLACQNASQDLCKLLLAAGADPNTTLPGGEAALMTAARAGAAECVSLLCTKGARIDATERRGQTALMWAAAEGHAEVVDLLLRRGAKFKTPLKSGFTPLLFAVREGHRDVVHRLLEAGVDVTEAVKLDRRQGRGLHPGTTPLLLAVENGHFELALDLVKAGADPNDQSPGFSALHAVTWVRKTGRGDDEAGNPPPIGSGSISSLQFVRKLVELKAEVNIGRKRGSGGRSRMHTGGATPFLLAAKNADLPLLKLLVELGADPSLANVEACSPLLAAAGMGTYAPGEEAGTEAEAIETVRYLLDLGADLNHLDKNGESAMHGAAYASFPEMVRLLDKQGADHKIWNQKNKHGWTPLVIAQGFRHGNFKPHEETIAAISNVMRAHGIEPPPPPPRERKKWEE